MIALDEKTYETAAKAHGSNCTLDHAKLLSAGLQMRSVAAALEDGLKNWQPKLPAVANGA